MILLKLSQKRLIQSGDVIPVSYTHLDVYKRQTHYMAEFSVIDDDLSSDDNELPFE